MLYPKFLFAFNLVLTFMKKLCTSRSFWEGSAKCFNVLKIFRGKKVLKDMLRKEHTKSKLSS